MDPAVLERLRDVPLADYSVRALKIVDKDGQVVNLDFTGRPGQIKLADAIESQKALGLPVRIILVKSRQFGGSTAVQAEMVKRATTTARRRILTVAHRLDTAESLFAMADLMYTNLPDGMRPAIGHFNNPGRGMKLMHLGEKVGGRIVGWPNSRLMIDTAEELGGGRGLTYTDLHLTEVAYWRDRHKALSLLPAVGSSPLTSIFLESTANGLNWFHDFVKRAEAGLSEYMVVFVGWYEDPDCTRRFVTEEAREEFVATIGRPEALGDLGVIAQDEPWLVEEFGCTPEQLHFRRTAIVDRCDGKVELFRQEYPTTLAEAFVGSGRQVFSVVFTQRAIREAEHHASLPPDEGGPQKGLFVGWEARTRKLVDGEIDVPTKVLWVPEADLSPRTEWWPGRYHEPNDPLWTIWQPKRQTAEEWRQAYEKKEIDLAAMESGIEQAARGPGQFIIAGDAAGDTFNDVASQMAESAWNTLVGIDHWTGVQVAEFRARIDHDLMAYHAFLAGMFFNEALLSIERTGGYGGIILDVLQRRLYYRRLYVEKVLDDKKKREMNRLGWDTNRRSKPQMEANAQALLREGTHGIRSLLLAGELPVFVKDEKNPAKHGPAPGSYSDLLMAWCQAQMLKLLKPPRPWAPKDGARPNSMTRHRY
jgi:hypothetical protein